MGKPGFGAWDANLPTDEEVSETLHELARILLGTVLVGVICLYF